MDTTATLRHFANSAAGVAVLFEVWPYLWGANLSNPDPAFWYSHNGFDHVFSALCPLGLFLFLCLRWKADNWWMVKAAVSVFYVSAMEVLLSDFIVVKQFEIWPYVAFVAMAPACIMVVWSRYSRAAVSSIAFYSFDMALFWLVWSSIGAHETYTGIGHPTVWFGDFWLNLLQIAGWVFSCAWFTLRVSKW